MKLSEFVFGKVRNSRVLKIVIKIKLINVIRTSSNLSEIVLLIDRAMVSINGLKNVRRRIFIFGNWVFVSMVKFVEKSINESKVVR